MSRSGRTRSSARRRFGRDSTADRGDFDDLLAGMTEANALARVDKACGGCKNGRRIFTAFKTVALCSYVREVEIDSAARRSPVNAVILALARELLIVCSFMRRTPENQWRASDKKLFRGRSHRPRSPDRIAELKHERRVTLEASGVDVGDHEIKVDEREYCPVASAKCELGARADRGCRQLHDHFKLLDMGGVLQSWVPPDDAPDAVHGKNGVYAMYELHGEPPVEFLRRWRLALQETWLLEVPTLDEPLPPRNVLAAEVAELLTDDSS